MENTDNFNAHKTFCYILLLLASGISLYLTVDFMYQLGLGAKSPFVFAIIGVCFDLFKSYSPTLVASLFRQSQISAIAIGLLAVCLIAISSAASIFALQNGIDSILLQSSSAQVAQKKIKVLESELQGLKELRDTQLSVHYISKASATSELIAKKTNQLDVALDQSTYASSDSVLSKFSTQLVYIIAVGIELISVAMTICLFHFKRLETRRNKVKRNEAEFVSGYVAPTFESETRTSVKQSETSVSVTTITTHEQVLENMRVAFQSGKVQPKHREIWEEFKGVIKQKDIKTYLSELAERNVLERKDNGSYDIVTVS